MVSILRTRLAATAALALLLLPLASACSGSGGEALPSRTATPSRTLSASGPSAALPSATRDSPSGLPSRTEDSESATADATDATDDSTPEQTAEESAAQPSVDVSVEESAAASETTESTEPAPSGGSDAWPLWVLVALVALGILFALWHHSHARRRDERAAFDLALSESRWVGEDLLPSLLMASRDERRGAWGVARPRVVALQHQLAGLATPGSESAVARNALQLETAVIGVRGALDDESRPDGQDSAAEALGAVKQSARQLDQVLADLLSTAARPG